MEAEVNFQKSSGEDTTITMVKDWMPLYVMMDFKDHDKQNILVVMVTLPTGVTQYNTTNTDISVAAHRTS